jgi:hypothetical protein
MPSSKPTEGNAEGDERTLVDYLLQRLPERIGGVFHG